MKRPYTSPPVCPRHVTRSPRRAAAIAKFVLPPTWRVAQRKESERRLAATARAAAHSVAHLPLRRWRRAGHQLAVDGAPRSLVLRRQARHLADGPIDRRQLQGVHPRVARRASPPPCRSNSHRCFGTGSATRLLHDVHAEVGESHDISASAVSAAPRRLLGWQRARHALLPRRESVSPPRNARAAHGALPCGRCAEWHAVQQCRARAEHGLAWTQPCAAALRFLSAATAFSVQRVGSGVRLCDAPPAHHRLLLLLAFFFCRMAVVAPLAEGTRQANPSRAATSNARPPAVRVAASPASARSSLAAPVRRAGSAVRSRRQLQPVAKWRAASRAPCPRTARSRSTQGTRTRSTIRSLTITAGCGASRRSPHHACGSASSSFAAQLSAHALRLLRAAAGDVLVGPRD